MRRMRFLWLVLTALVILSLPAAAETVSKKQVVAAGGGGSSTTGYRLISTVGQPCVGSISSGVTWHWAGFLTPSGTFINAVEELLDLPERAHLAQNHPNPFNPVTTIRFNLPEIQHVRLEVYSTDGRCVTTLIDETLSPGRLAVMWDGTDAIGHPVASGVYICRLSAGDFEATNRMVLSK